MKRTHMDPGATPKMYFEFGSDFAEIIAKERESAVSETAILEF